jgi:hypothetical protein
MLKFTGVAKDAGTVYIHPETIVAVLFPANDHTVAHIALSCGGKVTVDVREAERYINSNDGVSRRK